MKELTLCHKAVRVDADGLISLTDMWKASGGNADDKPALFLRSAKVKAYIAALEGKVQKCTLRKKRGGTEAGTWAEKLIAYKYAGWINPEFEVGAYMVLDAYFSGQLVPAQSAMQQLINAQAAMLDYTRYSSFHGRGLNQCRGRRQELQEQIDSAMSKCQLRLSV